MISWDDYVRVVNDIAWAPTGFEDPDLLQPRDNVRISDPSCVLRADEGGRPKLQEMRWSFPPARPGAGPLFNYRSEGRHFPVERRCLIPASAFFEFTASADPKQKRKDRWRFARTDGDWMGIAGIWKPSEGNQPAVFTMLTCEPGPDVAKLHNRQVVILEKADWQGWLGGGVTENEILKPTAAGAFRVEPA